MTKTTRTIRNNSDGQVYGYEISANGTLITAKTFGSAFSADTWSKANQWEAAA